MIVGRHILYLLTLYVHGLIAERDPIYRVNAMNDMFSNRGWRDLAKLEGIEIVVRWIQSDEEQILDMHDILQRSSNGLIVTYENADYKIRLAHQFLSCHYSLALKEFYEYGIGAANQCSKIGNASSLLNTCIDIFLGMVKKIDEFMVRLRGMFSCIYQLSAATTAFDKVVSEAIKDFESYYDSGGLLENNSTIIASTLDKMTNALPSLLGFRDSFCSFFLASQKSHNIGNIIATLERSYPPIGVMKKMEIRLNTMVDSYIKDYDALALGFEYDATQKTTRVMYSEVLDAEVPG